MELLDTMGIIGGADGPTSVFVAGIINTQSLVISIVAGMILCIFGLKLMRVLSAVVGMLIGAGIGAGIVAAFQLEGIISLAMVLGCGIVMALLSFFLKRAGAFLSVFCYSFGALLMVLPKLSVVILLIVAAVALILAVLAAVYMEPMVVMISSVAGGLMAGPAIVKLIGMDTKLWIGYIIAVVLAVAGVLIQLLMQSGKIKKKDKQHSQKVKEEASRESDVEKARMVLDEEDEVTEITEEDDLQILDDVDIEE